LPSLMTRAMCSSVTDACQAGSARFVAFSIGPLDRLRGQACRGTARNSVARRRS
jgi:hypothetical protein